MIEEIELPQTSGPDHIESPEPEETTEATTIPYNFARRNGVLLVGSEINPDPDAAHILYKPGTPAIIFSELRRQLKKPLKLEKIGPEFFDSELARQYESGT
ncbi:MAG: hypothetical protein KAR30_10805, partial [Gammaproteobacteria bacterium]|nr:hypothetical protein [Gammaproteobacteria bacterium]